MPILRCSISLVVAANLRAITPLGLALWGLMMLSGTSALANGVTYFRISEQDLGAALQQYAKQADVPLLFSSQLVAGAKSRPLFGEHSNKQALSLLLRCHGLSAVFSHSGAVAIKPAQHLNSCHEEGKPAGTITEVKEKYSNTLEEVLVTAQKREQRAQDVSIAITAFQSTDIKELGLHKSGDIAEQTPGVTIKNVLNKAAPVITIRGIGSTAFTSNGVAPIGAYVDEIFIPSSSMLNFSLFDIDRVEVLKGPQGTLFGRNTTGGAVSYITQKPNQEFDASVSMTLADYEVAIVETAVTGGLTDQISARIAAKGEYQGEGFVTNKINGESEDVGRTNRLALRAGVLWEEDDFSVYWNIHGGRDRSQNEPWVGIGSRSSDYGPAPELPGGNIHQVACNDLTTVSINYFRDHCFNILGYKDPYDDPRVGEFSQEPELKSDSIGSLLNIEKEFELLRLTAISAYENSDSVIEEDFDGGPYQIGDSSYGNEVSELSQEFRLTSINPAFGMVDWLAGFIYYQDEMQVHDVYGYRDRVNHDVSVEFEQETKSWALFSHVEAQLDYKWRLLAGLRYRNDEIAFDGGTSIVNRDSDYTGEVSFFSETPLLTNDMIRSHEYTGKLALEYRPQDNIMFYASVNRGYKAGVWNGFWAIQEGEHSSTDPEYITAYELGFKSTLADNTLQLNGALYYYDYTDMQLFSELPDGRFTLFNAGEAEVEGAEIELWWRPAKLLEIKGGAAYNRAKINGDVDLTHFDNAVASNSPEHSANGLIRLNQPIAAGLNSFFQIDFSYQSEVYFSLDNQRAVSEGSYVLSNLRLGLVAIDSWDASVWLKNMTDKQYYTEILNSNSAGAVSAQVGPPRTLGVTFNYRWQ